jgi:hypothetical protein
MLKQLVLSVIIGLCAVGYYAHHDSGVRRFILNSFLEQFSYALNCKVQAQMDSFSYNELRMTDFLVTSKDGSEWSWRAGTFSIAFSWRQLLLYGTFDLSVALKDLYAVSQVHNDTLDIDEHLYLMFKGPQLTVYTFLTDVICENVSVSVQDQVKKRFFTMQFDCKAKKIDNRLKATIDVYDGSLQAHERDLFKYMSGSLQLDSFDGQPTTDVCVKGAASCEIPQLGQEIMPCYISGSWHHNQGRFSLKNVDHSFAIDPILIKKDAGVLEISLEAKMPLSYIVHMCTNDNSDDRLQGNCTVQAKMQVSDDVRYAGNIMVQRMSWCDAEIGSLAKMTFEKKYNTVSGGLYLQRTSGACFAGSWSSSPEDGVMLANIKNNARLTFSPKHDWQIFPEDLCVCAERSADGVYAMSYHGKATHVKAQNHITSSGTVALQGESISAEGTLDEHRYRLDATCADTFALQTFKYLSPQNEMLAYLAGDANNRYTGFVNVLCVKDILKKRMQYDLQGEGLFNIEIFSENEAYHVDLHLHEGTIRLPRTYNFVNGFDCHAVVYPHQKKCTITDLECTLHNGSIRSKKMETVLSDDLSLRFVYAPVLIDHCLLNIEKELFAVISGSMLLSKKQDAGTRLSGTILIDRAQLKENLFSEVFQKNMRSFTSYSFDTRDDDMLCDIAVKTKHPVRVQTPFLQTDARIDLHVRNKIRDPHVVGSINLAGGQLHFPYKPLYITKGSLHFLPGKLDDPLIELEAKNTIKKNAINLHVTGSLHNHHVSLEASPTLTEEQIISLLLVGSQEESLNIVMPALIMQNIKSLLFGYDQSSQMSRYFGKLFKPFKSIHLVPSFIDQSGRGGLRGAIEIDISERCRALIQKNFSLTEDTRFELEYLLSDDISVRATRDIRRDLIAEVEMRYKFGNN